MPSKCPFCESDIIQGAVKCNRCMKVFNTYNNQPIYRKGLKKDLSIISFNDFQTLSKACLQTIQNISAERNEAIKIIAQRTTAELFQPSLDLLLDHGLVGASDKEPLLDSIEALVHLWILACFLLGVEKKSRRISEEESLVYLPAINFPIGFHLIEFILILKNRSYLENAEIDKYERKIKDTITQISNEMFQEGQDFSSDVQSKLLVGELTAFSLELKQIKTV